MNKTTSEAGNPLTSEGWSGDQGERWLAQLDALEAMIAPIGEALLARASYAPGEQVVDIGCGGGWTTRRIGEAVGPAGGALGLDISPALIVEARRRSEAQGASNVAFTLGDASVTIPEGAPYDRLFSRFGVMFFADPLAAFVNLRAMLREGGRLDMAVWAPPQDNDWMRETMRVIGGHIDLPRPDPDAPGPFSLADTDRIKALLGGAGFSDVVVEAWAAAQHIGGKGSSPEDAARFVLGSMQVGDIVRQSGPEAAAAIQRDLIAFYRDYEGPEGVALGAKAWLVSARG